MKSHMVSGNNTEREHPKESLPFTLATDLSMICGGSTDPRRQHSPLLKHRAWTPL